MFDNLFAVCLLVRDFEQSLAFYRDVLKLEVKDQDGATFANFKLSGTELAIFGQTAAMAMIPKRYMSPGGGAVFGFQVDDVAQTCATLQERGVHIFEGPKETDWGQKVAYFNDPDQNIWGISEQEGES